MIMNIWTMLIGALLALSGGLLPVSVAPSPEYKPVSSPISVQAEVLPLALASESTKAYQAPAEPVEPKEELPLYNPNTSFMQVHGPEGIPAYVMQIKDLQDKVAILQTQVTAMASSTAKVEPLFTTWLGNACSDSTAYKQFPFAKMNVEQKNACMKYWMAKEPFNPDGGTNMPQVWYDYYHSGAYPN